MAYYLREILKRRKYNVILTRPLDVFVSLSERVAFANSYGADLFVSIHTNADADPDEPGDLEAKGEEIWVYDNSPKGMELAEALAPHVDRVIPGHRFRGIKHSDIVCPDCKGYHPAKENCERCGGKGRIRRMYVLRKTTMPAVLIELGFIDSVDEQATLSHPKSYGVIAALIFDGINEYATLNHLPGG